MGTTILDTSSLIELALAQQETSAPGDSRALRRQHGGIDEAIEAFVLYDNLLFDEPSVRRNAGRLPQLQVLSGFGRFIGEDDGGSRERETYELLLERYLPFFGGSNAVAAVVAHDGLPDGWDIADLSGDQIYQSVSWRDLASEMTSEAREVAYALREQFGVDIDYGGTSTALLLRTLYYDCLQQCVGSDLVLHPSKGRFLGQLRRSMALESDLSVSGGGAAAALLDRFDEEVRRQFYERRAAWINQKDLTYEVPMLTAYVLGRCASWQDLFKVIEDVRESKQARRFRASLGQLLEANRLHKNDIVDAVFAELDSASDEWAKDLSLKGLKKKVTVGLPLFGLLQAETELELPDRTLKKSTADGLLVFIHSLLVGS